ncbi:MAG: 3-isopropylmalate dehydratase small subunit [Candidatus Jordarchaeum sp.]|uniref:3-isopropylmalate dehydratase small subunit n=1 Tax=Candidatus Jordarchaeum sp. TaxID=2823881 RepID=UPI00404A0C13
MTTVIRGKVWKFGDNIDTDIIIAGPYLTIRDEDKMASHAMEMVNPDFAKKVKPGDIIVAGKNFGCGSSREEAPYVLKKLGVAAIVAEFFARIFYRNAINLGLPLVEVKDVAQKFEEGDTIEIELEKGIIRNTKTSEELQGTKLPDFLMEIIKEGGAIEALKKKLK